jgi:hypothetical protein
MKNFKYFFGPLLLIVFFGSTSCRTSQVRPLDEVEDIWNGASKKIPPSMEKWKMYEDTTCNSIVYGSRGKIKIWGKVYKADGFLVIDHKKYLVTGRMANGLPTGDWTYASKRNCIYFEEVFKCGSSFMLYHYSSERFSGYGVSCRNYVIEDYRKELIKLLRFRNKLHKEIYSVRTE